MVFLLYDVTVSACATRASFFLIDRVRNQCLVRFPANVRLEPCVNDGVKRPLSQCQQRRKAPIIMVSWAPFSTAVAVSTEHCPKAPFQSGKVVQHRHNIGWFLCSGGREDYENQGDALIMHCALNSLICA